MKILGLEVSNVLKIEAVEIIANGRSVTLSGANATGKTSILQKAKREIEIANNQMAIDSYTAQLHELNLDDDVAVLNWWKGYAPLSDDIGVNSRPGAVIEFFDLNGWSPSVNLGSNFNAEDAHNYAAYIVGQALSCLQSVGAVHHVCLTFIEKWMAKFHPETKL